MQQEVQTVLSYPEFIEALTTRGNILNIAIKENPDTSFMKESLHLFIKSDLLLQQISSALYLEGSKLAFRQKMRRIYEQAIQTALAIYAQTKNPQYIHQAFFFSEKSKALLLLESQIDAMAKVKTGVSDSLLEQEIQLKSDLALLKKQLHDASSEEWPELRSRIAEKNQQLKRFIKKLEEKYPKYHQLKYNYEVLTLSQIQHSLGEDDALLEFFYGKDSLYAFVANWQQVSYFSIPLEHAFVHDIALFLQTISSPAYRNQLREYWKAFGRHSSRLYRTLFCSCFRHTRFPSKCINHP